MSTNICAAGGSAVPLSVTWSPAIRERLQNSPSPGQAGPGPRLRPMVLTGSELVLPIIVAAGGRLGASAIVAPPVAPPPAASASAPASTAARVGRSRGHRTRRHPLAEARSPIGWQSYRPFERPVRPAGGAF